MHEYPLYINGTYTDSLSGYTCEDINPATNEVFAHVQQANQEDAKIALDNSWQAFQSWKNMSPSVREFVFLKAADLLVSKSVELKEILIDESGATALKAGSEIHMSANCLRSIAGDCRRVMGDTYLSDLPNVQSYSIRKPLGLVLAISPFNFPLLLTIKKIGWAIAAGNCVILKPSEVTPIIGLKLAEIFTEAGLPPGVLNVLPAQGKDLGDVLIADKRIKKVTFTGSTNVGRSIAQTCAKYLTKVTLEMGGKNPLIILNDADIDYAVNTAAYSNFIHQGQVCMTGSRVIVEADIYDEFVQKFSEKVAQIKYGNPREPGVIVGPLIRKTQPDFIQSLIDQAVAQGAKLLVGGQSRGNVYFPTLLTDVTQEMDIFSTECFGPVASVTKATNMQDAINIANNSEYGLSAAVITNNLQKANIMADTIESGMLHINGPSIRDEHNIPFGGVKNSGWGREGGKFSMEEFTELKWITIQTGQQIYPF